MKDSGNSGIMISVVICTFNRAELLNDVLATLSKQTLEPTRYEVIVIDNNSQDNTRDITEGFCRNYPNIRYFFETRQGLSYARNRGCQEAKGKYLAYIDDECKVPEQWLAVAMNVIDRFSPIVFGGPYYSYHKTSIPCWWKEGYGEFRLSDTARSLIPGELLKGANIFVQRRLIKKVGGFNVNLGMSGTKIDFGEESELQRRIRETMTDGLIYYDPDLYIYHLFRPEKMRWRYQIQSRFVGGRNISKIFCDDTAHTTSLSRIKLPVYATLTIFIFLASFFIGVLRLNRKRYPYLQNYLYEKTFGYVQTFGLIYEQIVRCK